MSKFDIVIYTDKCLPDKIIAGVHPIFASSIKYGVSSVPSIGELRSYLPKKKVAFLGGFFSHLYTDICAISDQVTFILRDEDQHPNLDELSCEVEKWFNYWCQMPNPNSLIMKAVYEYTYRYATFEQRVLYEGLSSYGVHKMTPSQLISFFKNVPTFEEVEKAGKDNLTFIKPVLVGRINSAQLRTIDTEEGRIKIIVANGDSYQIETCSMLLENYSEVQVACLFYYDFLKGKIVGFFISRGKISAQTIAEYFLTNYSGNKFISQGHKDGDFI